MKKKSGLAYLAATLLSAAVSTGTAAGTLTAADITDPSTQFFDAANGHIYQVVNSPVTWTEAFNAASTYTLGGNQGYLVTVTSAAENSFLFNLIQSTVSTGWDGRSIWLGSSDSQSEGVWKWSDGPEAGQQFWQGAALGGGFSGVYNNMYALYIQNENSACGISGCWSNPNGTGANSLFMYGGSYTPSYWDDAYSSTTATSGPGSPVVSTDGARNAFVIEYGGSMTTTSPVPEPETYAMLFAGLGLLLLRRRSEGQPLGRRFR